MTEFRRWGKAGVRLTPEQAAVNDRRNRAAAVRSAESHSEAERVARRKWEAGMVVPHNITSALDLMGMYGPEVDAACSAKEPEVDLWEAGKLYPRWDQFVLLARLTEKPLRWFTDMQFTLSLLDTSMRFHVGRHERVAANELRTVQRYPDDIVARCPGTDLWKAWHDR